MPDPSTSSSAGKTLARAIFWPILLIVLVVVGFRVYSSAPATPTPSIAFVTADATPYWDRVIDGANAAASKFDASVDVIKPSGDLEDQNRAINEMNGATVDGVAISPVDAVRQTVSLRNLAGNKSLVTVDSDSELSNRACFVGMDNYDAGRQTGTLIKSMLPDGGRVLIVSGPLDKANGRDRRQGLIDELMNRPRDQRAAPPAPGETVNSDTFVVGPTLIDTIDPQAAKDNVAAALSSGDTPDAIVGLYGYHALAIGDAVQETGVDGVLVIGFDALSETVEAMEQDRVHGIIAQDQFRYGYESVRILTAVIRGDDYAVPLNRRVEFPPVVVTRDSLESFLRDAQRSSPEG